MLANLKRFFVEQNFLSANFAETTGIAGFLYAYRGRLVEKCFWYVLIIGAFALTVMNLRSTIEQFQAELTTTEVIMATNETIQLPDPAICSRYRASRLLSLLTSASLDRYASLFKDKNAVDDVRRLMDGINVSRLHALNSEEKAFLVLAVNFVFSLSHVENTIASGLTEGTANPDVGWDHYMRQAIQEPKRRQALSNSLNEVKKFLVTNAVDFGKWRDTLAKTWLSQFQIDFTRRNEIEEGGKKVNISNAVLTWFGAHPYSDDEDFSICIRVPNVASYMRFSTRVATNVLYVGYKLPNFAKNISSFDLVFSDDPVGLDSKWKATVAQLNYRRDTNWQTTFIRVVQRHSALNLRRRPCLIHVTQFICQSICHIDLIVENCKCYPINWLSSVNVTPKDKRPYCGFSDDVSPSNEMCERAVSKAQLQSCLKRCYSDCVTTTLAFERSDWYPWDEDHYGLAISTFNYMETRDHYSMTAADLVGNVGGILGVWTGASVIAYLHVVICFVKWLTTLSVERRSCNRGRSTVADPNVVESPKCDAQTLRNCIYR